MHHLLGDAIIEDDADRPKSTVGHLAMQFVDGLRHAQPAWAPEEQELDHHHPAFEAGERRRVTRWVNDAEFGRITQDGRCGNGEARQPQSNGPSYRLLDAAE